MTLSRPRRIRGVLRPPGDKSITHRALILSALSRGTSEIGNPAPGVDVLRTVRALKALGLSVVLSGSRFQVKGCPKTGFREPLSPLQCGNSGTTARLLMGLLAGRQGFAVLTGDASLRRRPMGDVITPLMRMGASILARGRNHLLPAAIQGARLHPIRYSFPDPSAQVKSALLIAGIQALGTSTFVEPVPTRDHTERLLKAMGARIQIHGTHIQVATSHLTPISIEVPGDFSSSAYFLALTVAHPDASVCLQNVGLNPTRTAFLNALQRMGARISVRPDPPPTDETLEPIGEISAESSSLKATRVEGIEANQMLDEIPLLAVVATQADGETVIRDVPQLRQKESDRIHTIAQNLNRMGARVQELPDGLRIQGPTPLQGASFLRIADHRILMSLVIACCLAHGKSVFYHPHPVNISYPSFFEHLQSLLPG